MRPRQGPTVHHHAQDAFKRAGSVLVRLALLPVLCEAVVDGWLFYWCACSLTAGGHREAAWLGHPLRLCSMYWLKQ